jgi:uncharacterized protein YdgA (DUF945 family)
MSRATKFAALGVVSELAVGALGVPWYSSQTMAAALNTLAAQPSKGDVVLRKLAHEAGLFSSKGSVEVAVQPNCSRDDTQEPITFKIEYAVSHLPSWAGLNRFEWKASPLGASDAALSKVLGGQGQLSGKGAITYAGLVQTSMALPEINFARGSEKIQVTPSQGSLAIGKTALQFDWTIDRAVMRANGQALEMKQTSLVLDLNNRAVGTGAIAFEVASLSTGQLSLEGLRISSDTRETGDRLNSNITQSIRSAQFMGQSLKNLKIEAAIKGLHTQSVRTLTTLFGESCGIDNMTADEHKQVRAAVKTLLTSGLSFGIPALKGSSQTGGIDGNMEVALLPAKADNISLATQLKSTGQMTLTGNALTPEQKQTALTTGFAREVAGGLQASYDYSAGLLKVSGKALDAGTFQTALVKADEAINAFLSSNSPESGPKPAIKAEEKEEVIIEESAAPPSTLACGDVAQCALLSIKAAKGENIETVRQLATVMEALPKPDLGNKAQARKLNTQALESLKAENFNAGVTLLQSAVKENPRDVEVLSNLGFALVKAGRAREAVSVLTSALVLDPRRTSTWTPLSEALALSGKADDAAAALWIGYQWSGNRDKSIAFYQERITKEATLRPALSNLYKVVTAWVTEGKRPAF